MATTYRLIDLRAEGRSADERASETAERNGWDNSPNDQELANLTRLADFLEQVKVVLNGKPIIITAYGADTLGGLHLVTFHIL